MRGSRRIYNAKIVRCPTQGRICRTALERPRVSQPQRLRPPPTSSGQRSFPDRSRSDLIRSSQPRLRARHSGSPGSTQVKRHKALALRFQSLSSVTFESRLHSVARTGQARLVESPEPFYSTCCERTFRAFLQLPTRDQILTVFVHLQNDRQHRRPSVHFHPPPALGRGAPCRRRRIS